MGKDKVIFVTKEDHAEKSKIELPPSEPQPGLLLPSGEINWNCPCLGGMATGPCGVEFRDAFSCFHYSEAEPKGSDCYDAFKTMQDCMGQYPTVYNQNLDDDKESGIPGMDMSLDDDDDEEDEDEGSHAEYADEDGSKVTNKEVAAVK
jgi:intermembrane space import and assembly protein 40